MAKIIFYGGKGGVGKTTCSTANSIFYANKGLKTLLISTDPAHSISDVLEMKIGKKIINIRENLDGLEIDPEYEAELYIDRIRENMKTILSNVIVEEINKQLDAAVVSPGTHESALFDKMAEIIIDKYDTYDIIIFDTAPTGHTLRLLTLPELLEGWMGNLIKKRKNVMAMDKMITRKYKEKDPVLEILEKRQERLSSIKKILIDNKDLTIRFVLNAEQLPIEETKKAVKMLEKYNLPVETLVINRILPENIDDNFWVKKKIQEKQYLTDIENYFADKELIRIPLMDTDMNKSTIDSIAKYFD
ncbi:MAG: TRC40/GET3/ArsA family transport-energizing ATPase [Clostridiales bacterium]|nr:TRC40/GET3/ArsA family transport-energizing ATPase [Clostridiales bacterium]